MRMCNDTTTSRLVAGALRRCFFQRFVYFLRLIRPIGPRISEQQIVAGRATRDEDMEIVGCLDDGHASAGFEVVVEYLRVLGTNAAIRDRLMRELHGSRTKFLERYAGMFVEIFLQTFSRVA